MEVSIIEKETGNVACVYLISERGLNFEDYYLDAWRCALEDGAVDADEQDKYTFSLDPET